MFMEREPEESDKDVQREDKPTVLWKKCIQQSIFVDLSEDESLHLSDLEGSLALHLSQAESAASEASVHLSGSSELSALDISSSESSTVSSKSERRQENKSKVLHVSARRPNTRQDKPFLKQRFEDTGQNTSDEDQDDLPYDGDLGSRYFNRTAESEGERSSYGRETVHASPDAPGLLDSDQIERDYLFERFDSVECKALTQEDVNAKQKNAFDASKQSGFAPSCPTDINQVLLRHFSQEELLQSGQLIEAETLPEVSLLESMDDTVSSFPPALSSTQIYSNHTEIPACTSEDDQSLCSGEEDEKRDESQQTCLEEEALNEITTSSSGSINSRQEKRDTNVEDATPDKAEKDDGAQRVPFMRTRSFTEMKYGQGKVHYPLPDFSKVAPRVKIPKTPSGPPRPVPQSSGTMHRTQSSPGMLDLVSRVLEDSVQIPDMSLIAQMRIGANTQPVQCEDDRSEDFRVAQGGNFRSLARNRPPTENFVKKGESNFQRNIKEVNTDSCRQPEHSPSDGERMTQELKDIIGQFMLKVEEFKLSVSNMSLSPAEQQIMLRSLQEAQDQLERKYMCMKEEHRALEMQNYMGLNRNTGTFDPDRQVEGDIFRIGMHLEDVKEVIDRNVCEQISPPHSSSTPTPMRQTQHVMPRLLCESTPSPPPSPSSSLHKGLSSSFSTAGFTKIENDEDKQREVKETSEVQGDDGLQGCDELRTTDSLMRNSGHSSCHSRSPEEGPVTHTAEPEEEESSVFSDACDHSNILAYLHGAYSSSGQSQGTPDSCSTPAPAEGETDPGYCMSLSVEVSFSANASRDSGIHIPPNSSSSSQRIISPETDSGFGSSYLNHSASGLFQTNLLRDSGQSQNDGVSSTDSEGSCSNLQTAIHSAGLTRQRWASPHPSLQTGSSGGAGAVERWVERTIKEPSVHLQGPECSLPAPLHHCSSEPVLSATMETEERGSSQNPCSCNSEAILALQSEVSRLKRDLEEGLVQLPHLAQKMDFLTSRYRQDRQERRSKTRTRTRHRLTCDSLLKPSSSKQSNLSSSQVRTEDWISSDLDPSTESSVTSASEIMVQFQSLSAEGRRGFENTPQSHRDPKRNSSVKTSERTSSRGREEVTDSCRKHRQTDLKTSPPKERWSLFSSPPLHKPLLQVSYGSSSSLPASYKVRELPVESTSYQRKHSTQSDSALLPSNVYFQRTLSPVSASAQTGSRTSRRRGSRDEELNRALDQVIELARHMKRTTDRMAKTLTADLAEAKLQRKLYNMQPLGGRKHQTL
ncbi:uncharacterized protein aknad1 [Halichoeres trimaculatus]|uniref:uncharacterized protein aknad1 n=1 Tax=Halichoeres trimaculatus TaxID=147232 RepID=UPI003D9E7170